MGDTLANKVALVTGAGGGIGRRMAQVFAREGAAVVISDIDVHSGEETLDLVRSGGGRAAFCRADVGDEREVEALLRHTLKTFDGLHCAVNNAGVEPDFVPIHELSLANWEQNLRVNLTGVFLCMKHEIAHMRERGGSIVNISSVAAEKSVAGVHVYAAAKRGVLSLTSCAAIENGPQQIRVNAIMPGGIATRMLDDSEKGNPEVVQAFLRSVPLGSFGQPEHIAQAALWLLSDAACYVTGQYLAVDGGITA